MLPHSTDFVNVLKHYGVDPGKGLESEVAMQRLSEYGENKLKDGKNKTVLHMFFAQFKDLIIIIMIIAAITSYVVARHEGEGYFDPLLILLIVVINAIVGVVQEGRAEKALEALKNLSVPNARVYRDGKEIIINAEGLVPGDIIKLEAGDYIPADARIIEANSLASEESALTGESVPTDKDAESVASVDASLGDRHNMLYFGCSITYGTAKAVITSTGMNTEMGKIADMLDKTVETRTPLQHRLDQLGKYLGFLAIGISVLIFAIGYFSGIDLIEIFMIAVALAVSAIPEGLPAVVTVVLSIGVQRMVKKNVIVRKLPAVETLGSVSVICSDKTGTLTQNKMTLVKAYSDAGSMLENIDSENSDPIRNLLIYATLCSEGIIDIDGDGIEHHIGDPTETSIIAAAYKNGLVQDELNRIYPRLAVLPFDSNRKMMATVNDIEGRITVIVKGAYEFIQERCIAGDLTSGSDKLDELSNNALRVLAVAYKEIDKLPSKINSEELENGLTFMGILGMIDPPRPEAIHALSVCRMAGIKTVMITGDHVSTASAIAKELGIYLEGDETVTGEELVLMTDTELSNRIDKISVFARVSPEDKLRIIKAWQERDAVVSMTGDGVNDAPALKAADIGCAMGITGTDVAKGASDMILTDDKFSTIVEAVKEGRGIYTNIKHTIGFLLGTNIGEVLVILIAMSLWQTSPLLAAQLLWINLITDSLPAIALGIEPIDNDVMKHAPKPKGESIFAGRFGIRIVLQGFMFALLTLYGYISVLNATGDIASARTTAFITLASSQMFHAYNMRSSSSLFKIGVFSNKYLNIAVVISFSLMALVLFIPPIAATFSLKMLTLKMYLTALGLAFVPVLALETYKNFFKAKQIR